METETSEAPTKPRTNWGQVFATALITGLFMVAASVVTYYITTKTPRLTYSLARGPAISSSQGFRAIYVVSVSNSGKLAVESVTCHVSIAEGQIEDARTRVDPAIPVTETKGSNDYNIAFASLNAGEGFSVGLMLTTPNENEAPQVGVRGKGVVAERSDEPKSPSSAPAYATLFMVLAAMLGVITSFMYFSLSRASRASKEALASMSVSDVGPFDRNEVLAYILSVVELHEEANQVRFAPSELSYRSGADYITSLGSLSPEKLPKCVGALKALLLDKAVTGASRQVILQGLRKLGQDTSGRDLEERFAKKAKHSRREPSEFRQAVDALLSESPSKPTLQGGTPSGPQPLGVVNKPSG